MEEKKELACAEKIAYDTKAQAESGAVVADWQHGTKLKAYKCRDCHLWHLASK